MLKPLRIDRANLHAELDDYLDLVEEVRPDLELGNEHVLTISGGCIHGDDEAVADFTVVRTQTRHA